MAKAHMCLGHFVEAEILFRQVIEGDTEAGAGAGAGAGGAAAGAGTIAQAETGLSLLQQAQSKMPECETALGEWRRLAQKLPAGLATCAKAKVALQLACELTAIVPASRQTRWVVAQALFAAGSAGLGHPATLSQGGVMMSQSGGEAGSSDSSDGGHAGNTVSMSPEVRRLGGKGGYLHQADMLVTSLLKEKEHEQEQEQEQEQEEKQKQKQVEEEDKTR